MTKISATAKSLIYGVAIIYSAALLIGLAVILTFYRFDAPLTYALGLTLGSLWAMARVILLERSVSRSVDLDKNAASVRGGLSFLSRYAMTGAVLFAAAVVPWLSLIGAAIGVLSLQPAAFVAEKTLKRNEAKG